MLRLVYFTLMLLLPQFISAQTIANYSDWKKLPEVTKVSYLLGAFDQLMLTPLAGDDFALRQGLNRCVGVNRLTPVMLAEAVDMFYDTTPDNWKWPPTAALQSSIVLGLCLDFVNEARRESGLAPWSSPEEQATP